MAKEHMEGKNFDLEFHWVPVEKTGDIEIYPENAKELLLHLEEGVKHFFYKE